MKKKVNHKECKTAVSVVCKKGTQAKDPSLHTSCPSTAPTPTGTPTPNPPLPAPFPSLRFSQPCDTGPQTQTAGKKDLNTDRCGSIEKSISPRCQVSAGTEQFPCRPVVAILQRSLYRLEEETQCWIGPGGRNSCGRMRC